VKTSQLTIAICCACFALTAFAQVPPSGTGLTANPVFEKNCEKCHGKTAKGRRFGGPSLISPKTAGMSGEQLHNTIANGKGHIPKFRMPKFRSKLSSDEINGLVRQIQALNGR
jgi:mono/diheme cytochrome c family protein